MTLNNTPFNWKNKTEFIPTKPPEKIMSTYDYLNNAETELRNALKSTTDLSSASDLNRIINTIDNVSKIKNQFKYSVSENRTTTQDGFFISANTSGVTPIPNQEYWAEDGISLTGNPSSFGGDNLILG